MVFIPTETALNSVCGFADSGSLAQSEARQESGAGCAQHLLLLHGRKESAEMSPRTAGRAPHASQWLIPNIIETGQDREKRRFNTIVFL